MYNTSYIEEEYFVSLTGFDYEDEDEAIMQSKVLGIPVPSPHKEGIVYINGVAYDENVVDLFDYQHIEDVANAIVG